MRLAFCVTVKAANDHDNGMMELPSFFQQPPSFFKPAGQTVFNFSLSLSLPFISLPFFT
jgi:hypothetical protein